MTSEPEQPTSNHQHPTTAEEQASLRYDAPAEKWDYGCELREGETGKRRFDLEERRLEFASAVIDLSEQMPASRAGNHVAGQILRSGTSPDPNHGEAEEAESREDFIHKLKICLKELRETRRWARLIELKGWAGADTKLAFVLGEVDQLTRIFYSSIQTAKRNALAEKRSASQPGQSRPGPSG